MKSRNCWLYELKNNNKIVYFGITNDPDRRVIEHQNSLKHFTHMKIKSVAVSRETAEAREEFVIQGYQYHHGGNPPKYNKNKVY